MISVIICSINKAFAKQVQENIAATIGVPFEVIVIDNTIAPKSITAVYNEGAAKANYEVLCFAHEDILFNTLNWGKILVEAFSADPQLGLIGLAGSKYKALTPSGWFTGIQELDCCNIYHREPDQREHHIYFNPQPGTLAQQVVVLDGVFLCSPRAVWQQVKFDEVQLNGFHLYDIDYSLRVSQCFRCIVTYSIDLLHITKGNHFDNRWLSYTLAWHQQVKAWLPAKVHQVNALALHAERRILKTWLIRLKHERITMANKLTWLKAIRIWRYPFAWPNAAMFLLRNNNH